MDEIEIVYVTTARGDRTGATPKRRTVAYRRGGPLPRIGESVIIAFEAGAPTRYIVQDIAHVIEDPRHDVVVSLAAPYVP